MDFRTWNFILFALQCNFLLTNAGQTVFPAHSQAHTIFLRPKRANAFFVEEILKGNLERECYEERCNKEEAREVFENNEKTEEFWATYYDGDQCKTNPCQHGGACKDTVGGYSCKCTDMYSGFNCEKDVSQCPSGGPLACEHYCKPTQGSYRCFCAKGYSLHSDGRSCVPQVQNPCGNLRISSERYANLNKNENELGKICSQGHCPWQVTFVDGRGDVVCHGVILGRRSVLTTAGCMTTDKDLYMVFAGHSDEKRNASQASKWTLHRRYILGQPDDDLAFLQLKQPITLGPDTVSLCLPEKDYSENILMRTGREGVVVSGASHPSYLSLEDCQDKLNLTFSLTNKMFCIEEQEPKSGGMRLRLQKRVQCDLKSGTPAATVEGNTAFLTGLSLSQNDCNRELVFTKVSRYTHWIRPLLLRSEAEQR
ncbi:protein Z, vitamin K-dependent plasma glycoprotein b [Colossoma macropomum]|uniref:protein Z, vitamin K-dependent plasma glycoprotein b n=1 Tax=Colossoma macropomum TaxID=42526 RepID=UPI0018644B4F|nr:protein Z, vitamin K-dependent plasma glycoprotein b [Colossoma macropomum]